MQFFELLFNFFKERRGYQEYINYMLDNTNYKETTLRQQRSVFLASGLLQQDRDGYLILNKEGIKKCLK
jgi:hypothetical protein